MKSHFVCNSCGHISSGWLGRCPECGSWNSFTEEIAEKKGKRPAVKSKGALPISDVTLKRDHRRQTGISELDRVLGGGIVQGSLILVGGDPGIGKSTLLLQMAMKLARQGERILYVSGEESAVQIRLRAERLGEVPDGILLLTETLYESVESQILKERPDILIVDSIQTMSSADLASAPGSVSQIREVTAQFARMAKHHDIATFIVGHVTKAGSLAGPKVLEHMVDTVLYFEGDGSNLHRILRSVKNRFGSTNEVGIFSMTGKGLMEVLDPSEIFMSRAVTQEAGTVIFPSMEGTRPLLVEIQSLVSPTNFGTPRRMSLGVDYNKLIMGIAILEKKRGLFLQDQDVYVNAVGGISINEPALSLAMMMSIASSFLNRPVEEGTIILGEVGLLGEIRGVPHVEKRVLEAKRLGYRRALIPKSDITIKGMEIHHLSHLDEAFARLF